ncbi:MAG: hypothetical protein M3Q86_02410 [Verrucomicrobiota bacterium]|nr:hypothetical protein [Verrucomicrobiota bacterium]
MNICEIDWRIEPLHNIVLAIDAGLAEILAQLESSELDGLTALEHAEPLLGLGFVAAQNYALGAWTDLNHVRRESGKAPVNKLVCYKSDSIAAVPGTTRMEAINATANYFKHKDEWSHWPIGETTRTLARIGINASTEFPCSEAARFFCGDGWKLIILHQIVKEWREHIFRTFR